MSNSRRVEDNHPPVYVVKASFVQWAIFGLLIFNLVNIATIKEQFAADMESQQRLFIEANRVSVGGRIPNGTHI